MDADGTVLESSGDGTAFKAIAPVPDGARTIAFAPATARFFRVSFRTPGAAGADSPNRAGPAGVRIAELVLHPAATVNRFQDKAAFSAASGLYDMATPAAPAADRRPQGRRRRPDGQDAGRRHARLDAARRPLGRPPPRLFPDRRPQLPGLPGSHRPRGRQAQPGPRQVVLRALPRPLQGHRRPAHGPPRPPVRHHRQLGGRGRQLDRRHAGRVRQAPRLRHAALAAGPRRPGRRERRDERPLPLGFPADALRPRRRGPLRPADDDPPRARHGPLQRIARVRPRLHRRRHGGQARRRRADERHVDRRARPAQPRRRRRRPRVGLGRPHLRPEPGRGRIPDRLPQRLAVLPRNAEVDGRPPAWPTA